MNQTGSATAAICPHCGDAVLGFTVDAFSWVVYLEGHSLPVTADLAELVQQYRIWEDRGPRIGWVPKYQPVRTWRDIRATHLCAGMADAATYDRPTNGGGKHKPEHKERTT